jgi:EmrB/QacA subfamily drug resistance transporter
VIAKQLSQKRIALIMTGTVLSLLLSSLDNTIVGTAMPKIIRDLHGMDYYAWPFTAYMLFSTTVVPIAGKVADLYGRKGIHTFGILLFIGASALCGLSAGMTQLIIFRGLQGIGGGIIMTLAFTIVAELFPPRERGKYMGFLASTFAVASVFGPTLGGFITDTLSWRWIFYVNLPIGFVALALLLSALPPLGERDRTRKIDGTGVLVFLLAVFPLLLALSEGGKQYRWSSPMILGLLLFSGLMMVLFVYLESRSAEPLLSLGIFKDRVLSVSAISCFVGSAGIFGATMFIPLFGQSILGMSATKSGFVTTPMMVSMMGASILSGAVIGRINRYRPIASFGYLFALAGMGLLAFVEPNVTYSYLLVSLVILGFGFGITFPIYTVASQNVAPPGQLGAVTSIMQFFRQMGGTVGSAVLGSIMLSSMNRGLGTISFGLLPPKAQEMLRDPKLLTNKDAVERVRSLVPDSMMDGFEAAISHARTILADSIARTFFICVFILMAAAAITLLLDEKRVQKATGAANRKPSGTDGELQSEKETI